MKITPYKKIAILQSNYIPWKGYFDIINMVDEFVIYDEVQYTKGDWRNRNRIMTRQGVQWLTVPVNIKGRLQLNINQINVADKNWSKKHWKTLCVNYGKAPYFSKYKQAFEKLYAQCEHELFLSRINYKFIRFINKILGINTVLTWSDKYNAIGDRSEKLLDICMKSGAKIYLSGPAAKAYLNLDIFRENGVSVQWMNYFGYPEYTQMSTQFEHGVTILDLIFNKGPNAHKYMKSFG